MSFKGKGARAMGLLAAAALGALGLVAATQAAGIRPASTATTSYLYWIAGASELGRANTDGSDVNANFLNTANNTDAVAADGQHVYWANEGSQIGRANLDGSDANQSFISGASFANYFQPIGLAVDSNYIYWTNNNSIGRANLDGTNVDQTFINGVSGGALAVDGQHIYWTTGSSIARANLDGSNVDQTFITGVAGGTGDSIAVNGQYIYWGYSDYGAGALGRANLDGTGVNQHFINGCQTTGDISTCSVWSLAVDGQHIYWGGPYYVASANLDGTGVQDLFGATATFGVAVTPPVTVPTTTTTGTTGTTTTPKPKAAVTVIVKVKGKGHVSGGGVLCPSKCTATVVKGSPLTLRARAARGYRFAGWGGACPSKVWGVGGCTLAVYLSSSGHPLTEAKIAGQGLWTAFATPNAADAVKATATFVRK